jgi:hypothetical protein
MLGRVILLAAVVMISDVSFADEEPRRRRDPADDSLNASIAIVTLYNAAIQLSNSDQGVLLRGLRSDVRAALWTYNLRLFLRNHRDLSREQTAVLYEGIRLLANTRFL